jgi:hypothetical protein
MKTIFGLFLAGLTGLIFALYPVPTRALLDDAPKEIAQEKPREIPPQERLYLKVKSRAEAAGVPPNLAIAMVRVGSQDMRPDHVRFDPDLFASMKKEAWMTPEEFRLEASAMGYMRVTFGPHKKECELKSFGELLQEDINLDCGLRVIRNCLSKYKRLKGPDKVEAALKCYNNDPEYAPQVFGALLDLATEGM